MQDLYSLAITSGIDAEYFLDKMQDYELESVIRASEDRIKPSWEQARMVAYIVAQCNSTKTLLVTDVMKFPWDATDKEEEDIDWDEIRMAKEKLKQIRNGK